MNKKTLKTKLLSILNQHQYSLNDLSIDKPKDLDHGDFATPIAFSLAKKLKKSPIEIADEIIKIININSEIKFTFDITNIKGYINFKQKNAFLWDKFNAILNHPYNYTRESSNTLLEYVSANPTGPLHIGHGRWAVIGSVIANLFKETNKEYKTEFYINDAGSQIKKFYESINAIKENRNIPDDGYHGTYIKDLAKTKDDPLNTILNQQKHTLSSINVNFDNWFSEKSLHKNKAIQNVLNDLAKYNLTYEKENATWFKTTEYGDEKDRVLIKSDGEYTYFLVDIAYHQSKIKRGFTHLIAILGADHHGYIKRLDAAVQALAKIEKKEITMKVVLGQLVNLFRNEEPIRMSKRTGEMITLAEVIKEIGMDATRYYLIEKSHDTTINFDLELAKKQSSENPVYYIQYAHARMNSILKKVNETIKVNKKITLETNQLNLTKPERDLILLASDFHNIIEEATQKLSPYKIANYLTLLAKTFHSFYEKCPILNSKKEDQLKRIIIVTQTKKVFSYGLNLLGISAPAKM
tara:strand:+ start:313 stop:1881 length:1569 start_codon:yes stop_codon:yes gene_type:complete